MRTTRSMRRLKTDLVPDVLLRQVLEAGTYAAWRPLTVTVPAARRL